VPRVAFSWELGGEFGHAMSCAGMARALHARGHRIALIFRELRQLAHHPETSAYDLFTGPVFPSEGAGMSPPASLAEILLGCGYSNPQWLAQALREWIRLLREWAPDILVADYAPTALLAARVLGLPRVSMGISFAVPPPFSPLPPFRFDDMPAPERVAATDAHALANVNAALGAIGAPPLRALYEQFETDEDFLCTFPELDAYGNRPTARYWGPRFRDDAGVSVHWPAGQGKRILVYLKRNQPQVDRVIDLLAASPHRVAAFIPELEAPRRDRLRGPTRIVADKPIRYGPLIADCDLFISQAGSAATGLVALGVPQLMFPVHYEQYLTARRIDMMGAGITVMPGASAEALAAAFANVLRNPRFPANAKAFAKHYPAYTPTEQQRRIVRRIEDILAAPKVARETHA
jgi:UDP:flavonoid glycosyltransferase YjiC (YdhE family)